MMAASLTLLWVTFGPGIPFGLSAPLLNASARCCTQSFSQQQQRNIQPTPFPHTDGRSRQAVVEVKPAQVGLYMQCRVCQDIPLTCATTVLLPVP